MQPEQTVSEMASEVLRRQAEAQAERTGESIEEAMEAVVNSEAGRQLVQLAEGPHRHEKAAEWQTSLIEERAEGRARVGLPT